MPTTIQGGSPGDTIAGLSVADRIRRLLDTSDTADPVSLSAELLAGMSQVEKAQAFTEVAPMVVNVFATRHRNRRPAAPTLSALPGNSSHAGRPTRTRTDRCREWQADLRKRYIGVTGWKMLGEFTVEDFHHAAGERLSRAEALTAKALWMQRCAEAMKASNVSRFGQLPDADLTVLLGDRDPDT